MSNKPIIKLVLQKNAISVLKSTKNEYQNIDIDYNIGIYWSEMILSGPGNGLFCTKVKIIPWVPQRHKTPRNRYIENIGFKLEISYRFPKTNIALHYNLSCRN